MDDDNTVWPPIEPTAPVWKYPYDTTAHAPNPYWDAIPIPPPPPKKPRKFLGVFLVISLLLFCSALLFYWTYTYHVGTTQPTPIVRFVPVTPTAPTQQPTPTVSPYTAQDIMNEMIAHNLAVVAPSYGLSLAYLFPDALYSNVVNIPFQSSVAWNANNYMASDCNLCIGLWVYNSYDISAAVEQKLNADGILAQQTPAQGPTLYPYVTRYGRCIAQGVLGTPYAAVIQQYCV